MNTYEVGIYNKLIRQKIQQGERVKKEEAKWEDVYYFDIEAQTEDHAKKIIGEKYPPLLGFVVECITKYTTLSFD